MAAHLLEAEVRTDFGKGFARRARVAGKIPAVVYGHHAENVHLLLPAHQIFLIVKDSENALVNVKYEGGEQLALVKAVQVHPVRRDILHVDLLAVNRNEKVDVEVPVLLEGEPVNGVVANQELFHLQVKAPAVAIPENFTVSVAGLEAGAMITVADVEVPADVEVELPADEIVVSVVLSEREDADAAADEAEEAGEAAAE